MADPQDYAPPVPLPPEDTPEGSAHPSAPEVQQMVRSQNLRFGLGLLAILAISTFTAYLAGDSRAASRDSFNSTSIALANAPRSACITERRNAELDAIGDANDALGKSLYEGLVNGDVTAALLHYTTFEEASARRDKVSQSVAPDVLDLPPSEGGCGPPILSLDDLERVEADP